MPYVVGALGSRPAASKGLGRSGSAGRREPRGKRHAVHSATREVACGTFDALRVFDDLPWTSDGDGCVVCEAAVASIDG
jgi:hypothetical protein